jgi:hypothetical protein
MSAGSWNDGRFTSSRAARLSFGCAPAMSATLRSPREARS